MTPARSSNNISAMFRTLIIVGLGSFIGGVGRYLLQFFVQKQFPSSIPLGTLSVNIIGCFIIGAVYQLSVEKSFLSPELRIFLAAGICGGFTTFSSFAYENVSMVLNGQYLSTLLYVLLSVIIGFGAVHAGIFCVKLIS